MAQAPWCREQPLAHQRGARDPHRAVTPRGRRVNTHSFCPSPSGGVGGPSGRGGRLRPPGSLANQRGLRDRLCRYPPRERTPWGKAQDAASAPWPGARLRPPGRGRCLRPPDMGHVERCVGERTARLLVYRPLLTASLTMVIPCAQAESAPNAMGVNAWRLIRLPNQARRLR